ncbi:hypothetical protein Vau01_060370 [Virgisporangium aurantiacum]|uniref:Uncharacterized protein n=1 Tax=Virgisporangium aurantiacum TaxID=175570 RepID=A0A8J3ZB95_9ACTN|nr:hypothetical protein Vau01_060370 [Virgisporangium aurantiacum]
MFLGTTLALVSLTACGEGATSASPTTTVTASASARATGPIPSAGLLRPSDLSGAAMAPVDGDVGRDLRPPRPCGDAHPSDPARQASIAMTAPMTPANGPGGTVPSVILETIVRYSPGSGAQAFAELRSALQRCPGAIGQGRRNWEIVGDVDAGDEALLFRTSVQTTYGDSPDLTIQTWPVAVARTGDDLVLVGDLGWENMSGEEPVVRTLIATAVDRLRAAS